MTTIEFAFEFRSYWAVNSGFGSGALLDSVVVRTPSGLPYLPGRSVKGLFRHAVQQGEDATEFPKDTTLWLFGTDAGDHPDRTLTQRGALQFENAVIPGWEAWAAEAGNSGSGLLDGLFRELASTALADNGQVKKGSLRTQEVTIPLELKTFVVGPEPEVGRNWPAILETAAGAIHAAGADRHRGLGRVVVRKVNRG